MNKIMFWLLLLPIAVLGQPNHSPKYWIFFTDKPASINSSTDINDVADEIDLPVSAEYQGRLQQTGVRIEARSRWFNAVSARLTDEQRTRIVRLPFVQTIQPIEPGIIITSASPDQSQSFAPGLIQGQMIEIGRGNPPKLAPVLNQIQADTFAKAGLTGRFVTVGVIDAGFFGADSSNALKPVFSRGGVRAVRDYVNQPRFATDLLHTLETTADFHGTEVLSAIAGFDPYNNRQYGLATDATFYLARTDAGNREFRGEEDNWVSALEWLDSLGVRLVNTSLGYAKGFSNPKENYQPNQMDGHTSLISRAAQLASDKKGMLIIVSAGNEGDDRSWRIISTPADAQGVLAIGATNNRLWNRIGYSSIGPEPLPYLKPNVSCFSLYGTSLSAPVITGFAACLMQARPDLTNKQLMDVIQKSSHLYPFGNNYVGYGVPQASRALALLKNYPTDSLQLPETARQVSARGQTLVLPVTTTDKVVSVFHKKDAIRVLQQAEIKVLNGKITLKRLPNEARTTVDLKQTVVEVIWE
jgi:subtilisin family serine protease